MSSVLEIKDLSFAFTTKSILQNCHLNVSAGESVGVLGRNGAGKTTLFRLVVGLYPSELGVIKIAGQEVEQAKRQGIVVFIPDQPLLYPKLTLEENLAAFGLLWGLPPAVTHERAQVLLERLQLADQRATPFEDLSRGMKQKASIITGLLPQPALLLLDEPTNGLDYSSTQALHQLLQEYTEQGGALLLSTHTPDILRTYVDTVVCLDKQQLSDPVDSATFFEEGQFKAFFDQPDQLEQSEELEDQHA